MSTLAATAPSRTLEDAAYRKVTWRLVPFLMICYIAAYLDRVNVGFAKLQMSSDLQFSESIYGFGAGMFFIGYFIFEVPSNLILHRVGARVWIARIMITWGLISAAFMFVTTPLMFYTLRFLLGVAEAGFYPGIIYYLTLWYPSHRRAHVVAMFMTAIPLSYVFGGPLSGWIMSSFAGAAGWAGWQWLFLLEAVPSAVIGIIVLLYLDNGIRSAKWLDADEKRVLEANLDADRTGIKEHVSLLAVLSDLRIWTMCIIYFACAMGQYGLNLWMPTYIRAAGVSSVLAIGLLSAIPYAVTVPVMVLLGRSADRTRARRWHVAAALVAGGIGMTLTPLAGTNTALAVAFLAVAAAGTIAAAPLFWSLPTAFLTGVSAAAGIATINSVANLGGFISPYTIGKLADLTQSTAAGMYMSAAVVFMGAIVALSVPAKLVDK